MTLTAEQQFLRNIAYVTKGYQSFAGMILRSQMSGFPDITGRLWKQTIQEQIERLERYILNISDTELADLCRSLKVTAEQLNPIDDEMTNVIASFFDKPTPLSDAEKRKLSRKMNSYAGPHGGPAWAEEEHYQKIIANAVAILRTIDELTAKIWARLALLGLDMASIDID